MTYTPLCITSAFSTALGTQPEFNKCSLNPSLLQWIAVDGHKSCIFLVFRRFPDFIESRQLCWHGWGPRICFLFLDLSALLDSQGTEAAQGKKNIFLLQKETRENWGMLLWSSKSNNASSSVCSCHSQGTSHERRRGKTFSNVSQWLRTPQRFGECTNTSRAQGLRGTGLKKPSRPIIVTAQMEEVAAGYVYSDHQRAQRNAVVNQRENAMSQEEKGIWVSSLESDS